MFEEKLEELQSNCDLWFRLKCFHYDLKHFDKDAQFRLDNPCGEYYMNNYYFTQKEMHYLLDFPTQCGSTVREILQSLFAKVTNNEICTSHTIAPAIEKLYGIKKGYENEKVFKKYFKKFASTKASF